MVEVKERPIKLDPDAAYRLLTAKRSRGGIALRGQLLGREILTKTQFEAKGGDFLISRRQIIHGACGVVPQELDGAVVSNEYSTLRTRPAFLMEFLRHYSYTPYFQRTCFHSSHGVDVEKMIFKIDEWLARDVDVPPIGEQKKIAAILSSVDDAIEATQAVIDQLAVVKKAMMAELLTRGLPGRHTKFKMTEIGEVPESWDVRTVDSILESCTYGVNCPLSPDPSSGMPVLRMTNIQGDRLDLSDLKFGNLEGLAHDKIELRRGDLLFNRTNSAALVGKVALVDTDRKLSYASYLLRMRTNRTFASTDWLFYRLAAPDLQDHLRRLATKGVSQSNINPSKMRAVLVAVPSTTEQDEIVAALTSVDERTTAEVLGLQGLQALKAALMSVLLTGEVRVTPDEEAA